MKPTNEKLKRYGASTLYTTILTLCVFCLVLCTSGSNNSDKLEEKVIKLELRVAKLETKLEEKDKEIDELYQGVAGIIVELHPDLLDDDDKNNQNSSKKILKENN